MTIKTLRVTDYKNLSPVLAKVVVAYTGQMKKDDIRHMLAAELDNRASVVENSFKEVQPGVAVGYIRANREVRTVNKTELNAYRNVGSNIMMDANDQSLWDLKKGSAGAYLVRRETENLDALLEASLQTRGNGTPRLTQLGEVRAAASELVAYVNNDGDMNYGFAVGNTKGGKVRVVAFHTKQPSDVDYDTVVSIYPISMSSKVLNEVRASLSQEQKKDAIAYYTALFSFAPGYLEEIIRDIEQGTTA